MANPLVNLLTPSDLCTTVISGQSYATISLMLPVMQQLLTGIRNALIDENTVNKKFAQHLESGLLSKYALDDIHFKSPAAIASAIDPRFRDLSFLNSDHDEAEYIQKQVVINALTLSRMTDNDQPTVIEPPAKKPVSSLFQLMNQARKTDTSDEDDLEETVKCETAVFCTEQVVDLHCNVLAWWKIHQTCFPHATRVAREFLTIPGTSVPSEAVFSAAGALVTKLRSSFHAPMLMPSSSCERIRSSRPGRQQLSR